MILAKSKTLNRFCAVIKYFFCGLLGALYLKIEKKKRLIIILLKSYNKKGQNPFRNYVKILVWHRSFRLGFFCITKGTPYSCKTIVIRT